MTNALAEAKISARQNMICGIDLSNHKNGTRAMLWQSPAQSKFCRQSVIGVMDKRDFLKKRTDFDM